MSNSNSLNLPNDLKELIAEEFGESSLLGNKTVKALFQEVASSISSPIVPDQRRNDLIEWRDELRTILEQIEESNEQISKQLWRVSIAGVMISTYILGSGSGSDAFAQTLIKDRNIRAGKISGEVRSANADQGWRAEAIRLASEIRGSNPNFSQRTLATEVLFSWRADGKIPKIDSLINEIAKAEKRGALKKRLRR